MNRDYVLVDEIESLTVLYRFLVSPQGKRGLLRPESVASIQQLIALR